MKEMYVNEKILNEEEKRTGLVSYARLIEKYVGNIVLINGITDVDFSFVDNMEVGSLYDEEYEAYKEIYQYFACNVDEYAIEQLNKLDADILIAYHENLGCHILMVDHLGTSWDYVMTNVKWTTKYKEI